MVHVWSGRRGSRYSWDDQLELFDNLRNFPIFGGPCFNVGWDQTQEGHSKYFDNRKIFSWPKRGRLDSNVSTIGTLLVPHSLHLCFLSKILSSIEAQSLNKNDICYTFKFTTMAIETDENEKLSWQRHKFSSVFNCFHAFKSFVSHYVYVSCITYENFLPELSWLKFQWKWEKLKS